MPRASIALTALVTFCVISVPAWSKDNGGPAPSLPTRQVMPAPIWASDIPSMPTTPEEWVARMLDATKNGLAFKHPEAFIEWLDALSEPRFMTALATVAIEPGTYPKALGYMVDPSAARNWAEFTDPNLYLRWLLAGMDSRFYTAIYNRLGNPEKLQRWIAYGANPEALAALANFFGPDYANRWGKVLAQPGNYEPIARAINPATILGWMSAFTSGTADQIAGKGDSQWLRLPEATHKGIPLLQRY